MKLSGLRWVFFALLVSTGAYAQEKSKNVNAQSVQEQRSQQTTPASSEKKLTVPTQPAATPQTPAAPQTAQQTSTPGTAPVQGEVIQSGSNDAQQPAKPQRTGALKSRSRMVKKNVGGGVE